MSKDIVSKQRNRLVNRQRPENLFDMMENFWRTPFSAFSHMPFEGGDYPSIDVSESDKAIMVSAELPGVAPDDIEVTVNRGRLTIKGEKKFEDEEKKDNYHRIERSYGSFQRTVALPSDVDDQHITATFKNGVLKLDIPKSAASKTVKVKVESKG
ncbi:Hsp20/alpha crystallin family protein [Pseudodesulfovibrio portus]|uniref:SHSP domain-containing protein n=1 Tax=Pseudodesulfovibrio portus TaxID=231439 RepID=A0ABN6RZA6_9BACT|nr:Hsp20/alpha crystallin family protein [Pseudodesulfovibrio portus]BDQ34825.1 hypothetical protein JCM14722_23670 [Pseudodesulfovibrio portus]